MKALSQHSKEHRLLFLDQPKPRPKQKSTKEALDDLQKQIGIDRPEGGAKSEGDRLLRRFRPAVASTVKQYLDLRNQRMNEWNTMAATANEADNERLTRESSAIENAYNAMIQLQTEEENGQVWFLEGAVYEFSPVTTDGRISMQINRVQGNSFMPVTTIEEPDGGFSAQGLRGTFIQLFEDGALNGFQVSVDEIRPEGGAQTEEADR